MCCNGGMRPPTFHHERTLAQQGYAVIGVDEAGCGCLAGPVVAAACWLPFDSRIGLLRDSKLLSAAQREHALALLAARGAQWAVGVASVEEIDRINIRQASLLAMRRAVERMMKMSNAECRMPNQGQKPNVEFRISSFVPKAHPPQAEIRHSLFDLRHSTLDSSFGIRPSSLQPFVLVDAWTIPSLPLPQRAIIHGDRLVKSIAAASIIAKCTRDAMMDSLHREHPQYGFAKHRGYATEFHRHAIQQYGMTPHHRKSFCTHLAPLC